jgi:hypothetical protein
MDRLLQIQKTSRVGLESALTAAVAFADLLGADEIVHQLLAIKRDVLNTDADDLGDGLIAVHHTVGASTADYVRQIRAGR